MRRWLGVGLVALALGGAAFWWLREPSAEAILAALEVPPAPVLQPEAALASFRVAPGFRVELVAAEPLVVAPVAIDWDEAGRLYVVEMRGFMPNLAGEGEDAPLGSVAVLEDADADGAFDTRHVLRDGLVLPRAIAVLPEGVLLGVPPDLWLCPPFEVAKHCAAPRRLSHYGLGRHDPEHQENGLLPALDGWIYNAKSSRRFRLEGSALRVEATAFRGQWGIAQDDEGRLFYNHNSAFLYADLFPAEYLVRHPATDPRVQRPGVGVLLSAGVELHGVRVAPGLNRAYLDGTLRRDGRQAGPTAVSGLAVNRAGRFGPEARGDVFVPEPGGNAVARFRVAVEGLDAHAVQLLSDDPDWGEREFLASSDERFRPVNAAFGPDGALTVVDMYRGVIQHANYASDYLRAYVKRQGLEAPGELGRIWRVVPERGEAAPAPDVRRLSTRERVALLDHANGWLRDRAQRRLVHERDPAALPELRALARFSPLGRLHALWTLDALGALDDPTWRAALADADPRVRRAALRCGERLLRADPSPARIESVLALARDPDAALRLQALFSLGELPAAKRPVAALLAAVAEAPGDALVRQAVLSSLLGLETDALARLLADESFSARAGWREQWLRELAAAALLGAAAGPAPDPARAAALLDRIASQPRDGPLAWRTLALASSVAAVARRPGATRLVLAAPHPLFDAAAEPADRDVARALAGARRGFTWPGDPSPTGARPLTPAEEASRATGAALYDASCASCHGADGRGQPGLAPRLVGSPWVLDAEGWLVRIALHGVAGPLRVGDEIWDLAMPGHAGDPRFDDEALAGLLTHVRRAWGHAADPVAPERVAEVRARHADRSAPWSEQELLVLDVAHRLDRYTGSYGLPIVPMKLRIERRGDRLLMGVSGRGGMAELSERPDGSFGTDDPEGGAIVLEFEEDDAGAISGVVMLRGGGERIPWSREG
jgi:mono/diheme cytochrome c family protein